MSVFQLCTVALGGLFVILLLRQYHPVFAVVVSLAVSVVLLWQAVLLLQRLQQSVNGMFLWMNGGQFDVILRVVGVGLIVQTTAELCREAGQPALEGKVVLLGKLLILTSALPLVSQVLGILTELLL